MAPLSTRSISAFWPSRPLQKVLQQHQNKQCLRHSPQQSPASCSGSSIISPHQTSVRLIHHLLPSPSPRATCIIRQRPRLNPTTSAPRRSISVIESLRSVYRLDGGKVEYYDTWGRVKWQSRLTLRIFVIMGTIIACATSIMWSSTQMYIEYKHPTPALFSNKSRKQLRYLYMHTDYENDPVLANKYGRKAIACLLEELKAKGYEDPEEIPMEWRKEFVKVMIKIADVQKELGLNENVVNILANCLSMNVLTGLRQADVLCRLGDAIVATEDQSAAFDVYVKAVDVAWKVTLATSNIKTPPKFDVTRPVLPPPGAADSPIPSPELLDAIQSVGLQYCKSDPPQASTAFPIFLALLRSIEALPEARRDICLEATVQAYLGEVMFALGKQEEGYRWTIRGLDNSEPIAGKRRKCRDCAKYAIENAVLMRKSRNDKGTVGYETEVGELRKRQRMLSRFMDIKDE